MTYSSRIVRVTEAFYENCGTESTTRNLVEGVFFLSSISYETQKSLLVLDSERRMEIDAAPEPFKETALAKLENPPAEEKS